MKWWQVATDGAHTFAFSKYPRLGMRRERCTEEYQLPDENQIIPLPHVIQ